MLYISPGCWRDLGRAVVGSGAQSACADASLEIPSNTAGTLFKTSRPSIVDVLHTCCTYVAIGSRLAHRIWLVDAPDTRVLYLFSPFRDYGDKPDNLQSH